MKQRRAKGIKESIFFKLLINHLYLRVLVDCGATTNFMSPHGVRKVGLGMKQVELQTPCRTKWVHKIDLKSGYHQIEVDPTDQHKTAFKTRDGLYKFTTYNRPTYHWRFYRSQVQLFKLTQVLYTGVIFLDGQDIREFTLRRLRQLVSIVPQETVIFTGNVITNIAYGDMSQDIDVEAVARAARLANAHEFIDRLPEKYVTELGNRGSSLSGGQRQRLSIARAIYRSPTVLVLDEATSALDNQSEKLVREALEHLMEGRMVLVIAHRLETIRNADWILYMEGGEILEEGKHDELLSRGGRYSILYEQQASPGAAYGSQGEQLSLY
ncbi:hypothetical protein CBR_g48592 [Chara braunii]|uniref:ABC transporter domain-containing protein n=1 Tax=Chara braunii TaxID=69332 RepID=A0A388M3B6_CHABU|nr:hypothetical protein CBR_g48592 [Chara braunii]|eukprot:GBG88982.1 hypothetical protein CBR_g48592 [Chara braunii]